MLELHCGTRTTHHGPLTKWPIPILRTFNSPCLLRAIGPGTCRLTATPKSWITWPPWRALAVVTTEVPSATLNVHVAAGSYLKQDGTIGVYAGSASQAMTASMTNYLYLDLTNSGVITVNTSGFPATAHVRLATVVAGANEYREHHRRTSCILRHRLD